MTDIFENIYAGAYENTLPYARPTECRTIFDAYQAEAARLTALFVDNLRAHLGMEPGAAFDTLFAHAWERGHAAGFLEVASEATEAAELLMAGVTWAREQASERERKLRGVLERAALSLESLQGELSFDADDVATLAAIRALLMEE